MALQGYVSINSTATEPGAPIDAFLLRTLRQNSDLLESFIGQLGNTPWLRNDGSDGILASSSGAFSASKVTRADRFTVDNVINVAEGIPLVIMAKTSITINANINANGSSAPDGVTIGHLGGGGGGGANTAGGSAVMPFSNAVLAQGGVSGGASTVGADATNADPILRFFSMLPMMLGGGAGGNGPAPADKGGKGGGIIILIAPTITHSAGIVNASGANGTGTNAGGGGGGCILCVARTTTGFAAADFTGAPTLADKFNIFYGNGTGTGKHGGFGRRLLYTTP